MLRVFIDVGRFYPITIFTNRKAEEQALPLQSKEEVAANLLDAIMKARA